MSEAELREGKLYLCVVKDAYSGRVVGYSIGPRMKASLAVNALDNAVAMRGNVRECKVHSDRGSQFRSRTYQRVLKRHGLVGSMGRVGAAGDNAAMESFFVLLQNNVLNQQAWNSHEQLHTEILWWIEQTYHRRRRQARPGRLTPINSETIMNKQAPQAT